MPHSCDAVLLEWAKSHGVRAPGFTIAEAVDGERGIYAAKDLHAREEVVAVPRRLVLTDADARARNVIVRRVLQLSTTKDVRPEHQLVIYLVCQRAQLDRARLGGVKPLFEEGHKEHQSHDLDVDALVDAPCFGPWYDALPSDFSALPMCWSSDAALDALLPRTRAAVARGQRAEVEWLRGLLELAAPGVLAAAEGAWIAAGRPHDPMSWAYATVRSRAFQIEVGGHPRAAMCPLVDLINHGTGNEVNAEWGFNNTLGEFYVRATRPVQDGAQLLDSCTRRSASPPHIHCISVASPSVASLSHLHSISVASPSVASPSHLRRISAASLPASVKRRALSFVSCYCFFMPSSI